jgi:hypothetical protein
MRPGVTTPGICFFDADIIFDADINLLMPTSSPARSRAAGAALLRL